MNDDLAPAEWLALIVAWLILWPILLYNQWRKA